jgi:hypothetical protein
MTHDEQGSDPIPAPERSLAEEMDAIAYEPLLPVEKKLIAWCLILGVLLLGLLWLACITLFPVSVPATSP